MTHVSFILKTNIPLQEVEREYCITDKVHDEIVSYYTKNENINNDDDNERDVYAFNYIVGYLFRTSWNSIMLHR